MVEVSGIDKIKIYGLIISDIEVSTTDLEISKIETSVILIKELQIDFGIDFIQNIEKTDQVLKVEIEGIKKIIPGIDI